MAPGIAAARAADCLRRGLSHHEAVAEMVRFGMNQAAAAATVTRAYAVAAPRADDHDRGAPAAAPPRGQGKPTTSTSKVRGWRAASVSDLMREPLPRWLIRDWLAEDDVGLLYGAANAGKTAVTVGLVCAVATGRPWAGHEVRQGSVLMIVSEGRRGLGKRIVAWCQRHQHHGPLPVTVVDRLKPIDADGGAELREVLASLPHPPALIVIDHFRGHLAGAEDKSDDVAPWFRALRESLPSGSSCLILHHANKDGTDRGSTVLRDDPDMTARASGGGDTKFTKVTMVKSRESEERPVLQFALRGWTVQGMTDDRGRPVTSVLAEHKPAAATPDRPIETREEREARAERERLEAEARALAHTQRIDDLVVTAMRAAVAAQDWPTVAATGTRSASSMLALYGLEQHKDITPADIRASVQRLRDAGTIVVESVTTRNRKRVERLTVHQPIDQSAEPET
jgi:hypothetical protein